MQNYCYVYWVTLLHEEEEKDEDESVKIIFSYLYIFHTPCDIFIFFACRYILFFMFSTLISLEDRLRLKLKVKFGYNAGQPMAIPIYTVLLYCVMYIVGHLTLSGHEPRTGSNYIYRIWAQFIRRAGYLHVSILGLYGSPWTSASTAFMTARRFAAPHELYHWIMLLKVWHLMSD